MSKCTIVGMIATKQLSKDFTKPWWELEEDYEKAYGEDVAYMNKRRHRKEMDEMNHKRIMANRADWQKRRAVREYVNPVREMAQVAA